MNIKNIFKVSFWTFLSRILGLIRDMLLARYLGAGGNSDAFFIALKIPNLFRRFFAEGSMQSAFIPIFSKLLAKNEQEAKEFSAQVFTLFFLMLGVVIILFEIYAKEVVMIISPGFKDKGDVLFNLTVDLLRITLPYLFFISLSAFYSSILNALGKFALVAFLPAFLNICIIFCLYQQGFFNSSAHSASWGVLLGGLFQLLLVGYGCYKNNWLIIGFRSSKIKQDTWEFFKRLGPVIIGAGVYQINIVIDILVASFLPLGTISYLFYADRLYQLPLAIIGIAIATVILPAVSKIKALDFAEKNLTKEKGLLLALLFALPSSLGLIIFSKEIITTIFYIGEFSYESVIATSIVLLIYSISLTFNVIIKVMLPFFYAEGDTKTPLYSTMVCLALNIVFVFLLAHYFSYVGIAIATSIASIVNFLILWQVHQRKYRIIFSNFFKAEIKKIIYVNINLLVLMVIFKIMLMNVVSILNINLFKMLFVIVVLLVITFMLFLLKYYKAFIYQEIVSMLVKRIK